MSLHNLHASDRVDCATRNLRGTDSAGLDRRSSDYLRRMFIDTANLSAESLTGNEGSDHIDYSWSPDAIPARYQATPGSLSVFLIFFLLSYEVIRRPPYLFDFTGVSDSCPLIQQTFKNSVF